jgi:Arc/MetJ family transcription regulator
MIGAGKGQSGGVRHDPPLELLPRLQQAREIHRPRPAVDLLAGFAITSEAAHISGCWLKGYPDVEEVEMAKTLIDVNEEYLAAAQEVLHTETKKDTINAALRTVAALAARRRDLQRLTSGDLPDLADAEVMRAAWQR